MARISVEFVSYSSVLHATSSLMRHQTPPLGVNCVPAPTYMGRQNYVIFLRGNQAPVGTVLDLETRMHH